MSHSTASQGSPEFTPADGRSAHRHTGVFALTLLFPTQPSNYTPSQERREFFG